MIPNVMRALAAVAVAAVVGCASPVAPVEQGQVALADVHAQLFVPPGVQVVEVGQDGSHVVFILNERYPANVFIEQLKAFYDKGWQAAEAMSLFPGRRSSAFGGGWSEQVEANSSVHTWAANWVNPSGDVVSFLVHYRVPQGASPGAARVADVEAFLSQKIS